MDTNGKGRAVLLAACCVLLLTAAGPAAGEEKAASKAAGSAEQDKTWTNKDLEALSGGISILGGGQVAGAGALDDAARPHPEEWWRRRGEAHLERLAKLDAQLAELRLKQARAANPYTRSRAGTIVGEDGTERPLTLKDIQAQTERLEAARAAEIQGVEALRQAARQQGVPYEWVRALEEREAQEAREEQETAEGERGPKFLRPQSGTGRQ